MPTQRSRSARPRVGEEPLLRGDTGRAVLVLSVGYLWMLLWLGCALTAAVRRTTGPPFSLTRPFLAFAHLGNPSLAWGRPLADPRLYWAGTVVVLALGLGIPAWLWLLNWRSSLTSKSDPATILGVASGAEVKRAAGRRWLLHRADSLRPSLPKPQPSDVGYLLGRARGQECFCSVEDSIVLLGPPRSGKGLHLVIPSILDAPGAVITTSTRPDNLTATLRAREAIGPVAVFDPQRLAPGIPSATRWSPIRGCENPQIALLRAKALASGAAGGTVDSNFWQAWSEQAVRCLLHAAALGGRTPTDLYRWSLSA